MLVLQDLVASKKCGSSVLPRQYCRCGPAAVQGCAIHRVGSCFSGSCCTTVQSSSVATATTCLCCAIAQACSAPHANTGCANTTYVYR
jgi:hypothetical protein